MPEPMLPLGAVLILAPPSPDSPVKLAIVLFVIVNPELFITVSYTHLTLPTTPYV